MALANLKKRLKDITFGKRGNLSMFLLSLFLAFSVWMVHNLSREYTDLVSVNVRACSNIEGRAVMSSEPVDVLARCRTTGFRLLRHSMRRDEVVVDFDRDELVFSEGDSYVADAACLGRHSAEIFTDRVIVESFISPSVTFRFAPQNYKKVPVTAVKLLNFRPQYMARGDIRLTPDSVVVYGDPRLLAGIDRVLTRQITVSELRSPIHGVVKLENPGGIRLSETEVGYSLDVVRYVELRSRVRVGTRHVPAGRALTVLPSEAEVVYRCVFPVVGNPEEGAEFYVDYNDFSSSMSGMCVLKCDALPHGVIDWTAAPDVFSCVETI